MITNAAISRVFFGFQSILDPSGETSNRPKAYIGGSSGAD